MVPNDVQPLLKLDAAFLAACGLERLPPEEGDLMLQYVYETLELRVGERLAALMNDQQLDEFQRIFDAGDDDRAFRWLHANFPDYRQVVRQEYDLLARELRQSAPLMLALVGLSP